MANQFAGRFYDALFNSSSKLLKNTQFYITTDAEGLNLATTYTDRTKATVASPILGTDDEGMAEFYAVPGTYYIKVRQSIQKIEVYEDIADTADVQYVDNAVANAQGQNSVDTVVGTNGQIQIGLTSSHFSIEDGHGVYYPLASDTPDETAAYFDLTSRSLYLVGII